MDAQESGRIMMIAKLAERECKRWQSMLSSSRTDRYGNGIYSAILNQLINLHNVPSTNSVSLNWQYANDRTHSRDLDKRHDLSLQIRQSHRSGSTRRINDNRTTAYNRLNSSH